MAHTNQPHSEFDLIDGHAIDFEESLGTSDTYTDIDITIRNGGVQECPT